MAILAILGYFTSGYLVGAVGLIWAGVIARRDRGRAIALLILAAALLLFAVVFEPTPLSFTGRSGPIVEGGTPGA